MKERFGWDNLGGASNIRDSSAIWQLPGVIRRPKQQQTFARWMEIERTSPLSGGRRVGMGLEITDNQPFEAVLSDLGSTVSVGHFDARSPSRLGDDEPQAKRRRVEAVLFLSRAAITSRKLSQLAGLADATEARTLVRQLNQVYAESGRAFRAEEVAGGFQLMTRPALAPWLRRLGHIPKTLQLTPPAMETLAIIAYRQPVLRADIEAIRGVACGEILRQLMDRDLVRISGRSEELGRPYLYSTTKSFLQTFGLRDTDALPALDQSDFNVSENEDWSNADALADPRHDQQPVNDVPEEESDVSTAVANVEIDNPECNDDAYVGLVLGQTQFNVVAVDDEDEEVFAADADDDDEDFEDDDDWDDDEVEDVEDEEEAEVEDEDDAESEWEEVEEDEDEEWEDEEAEDADDEDEDEDDDDVDDWDDDDVDEDEDEEEWD